MTGKNTENTNNNYLDYVSLCSPKTNQIKSLLHAFWVGGTICLIGQILRIVLQLFIKTDDVVSATVSIILIFLGTFLTGLGVYDRIGKYAGGGSIVPITGFANSVASPALEFRSEGYVYGTAAKMFIVAGPIIVYGVSISVIIGLIYYIFGL